ncbi:MAG TPA: response regulator transcription factor, partial [Rubrobacter sp.]|nr:response regulator transcription factor [Rubrobacter sp.]
DQLLGLSPPPKIVVVTMHDNPRLVREFLGRGASAYLIKSASLQELVAAVHNAAESPAEAHDENVVMVVPKEAFERAEKATKEGGLSTRELEILLLVARGLSNRQISRALRVAEATVKRHLANLYPKMGVSSRGEATSKALSEGWISTRDVTRIQDR